MTIDREREKSDKKFMVRPGYVPDVTIGVDPEMKALCTAVREAPRREAKEMTDRSDWIRRSSPFKRHSECDIVQVTLKKYRHMAGFERFTAWNEGHEKRHPVCEKILAELLSFKTASYMQYQDQVQYC